MRFFPFYGVTPNTSFQPIAPKAQPYPGVSREQRGRLCGASPAWYSRVRRSSGRVDHIFNRPQTTTRALNGCLWPFPLRSKENGPTSYLVGPWSGCMCRCGPAWSLMRTRLYTHTTTNRDLFRDPVPVLPLFRRGSQTARHPDHELDGLPSGPEQIPYP